MVRKLLVLTCVLSLAVFVAACGSDDKKSDTGSTSTPVATTDTPTTDTGDTGDVASDPAVKQAVAACKQAIDSNAAVKDDIKSDLQGICDKAASGDQQAVKQATKEVCVKIVESSVPSGDAQDQAKQACDAATN